MKIGKMQLRLARRQRALETWKARETKVSQRQTSGGYRMPGSPKQSG